MTGRYSNWFAREANTVYISFFVLISRPDRDSGTCGKPSPAEVDFLGRAPAEIACDAETFELLGGYHSLERTSADSHRIID